MLIADIVNGVYILTKDKHFLPSEVLLLINTLTLTLANGPTLRNFSDLKLVIQLVLCGILSECFILIVR